MVEFPPATRHPPGQVAGREWPFEICIGGVGRWAACLRTLFCTMPCHVLPEIEARVKTDCGLFLKNFIVNLHSSTIVMNLHSSSVHVPLLSKNYSHSLALSSLHNHSNMQIQPRKSAKASIYNREASLHFFSLHQQT